MEKLSILFVGYDGYSDLWDDCVGLFRRFWPNCPYDVFFVNNFKDATWDKVSVIHAGEDAEWSKKVLVGLRSIKTKYVCLLLEDFFVSDYVDSQTIANLISIMERDKIDYLKLVDLNNACKDFGRPIADDRKIHRIKFSDDYGISLQASIWDCDYLKSLLGEGNYNAWTFEFNRVKDNDHKLKGYRENALFDTRNVLNLKHGVMQSEYIPSTIEFFKKKGINLRVERTVMSRSKYRRIRFTSLCKGLLPLPLRRPIKSIAEKLGIKFVSTVRDKR